MLQVTERMLTLDLHTIAYNQQFCIQIWQISQSFLYKMIEDTLKGGGGESVVKWGLETIFL